MRLPRLLHLQWGGLALLTLIACLLLAHRISHFSGSIGHHPVPLVHQPPRRLYPFTPAPNGETMALLADLPIDSASLQGNESGGKFEPVYGCYIGAYLDSALNLDSLTGTGKLPTREQAFGQVVGKPLASSFVYVGYGQPFPKEWARQMAALGIAPHIAMEPNDGLDKVLDDAYLQQFARDSAACGMPIFLRFASEMNGKWVVYHKDPQQYIEKFRLVHDVMARYAPNVAMLWCVFTTPKEIIADYYPGDDYVDWVGVNIYNVFYHDNDKRRPAWQEHPVELLDYVYRHYADRKPIAIAEYGATHYDTVDNTPRTDFACAKLTQLLTALPVYYPRVKLLDFFECNNIKYAAPGRRLNDYSVTDDQSIAQTTRLALSSDFYLSHVTPERQPPPAIVATRVTSGMVLQGSVRLSAWMKTNVFVPTVTFSVDGRDIDKCTTPGNYQTTLDTGNYAPGAHTLSIAAYNPLSDPPGKLIKRAEVQVVFAR